MIFNTHSGLTGLHAFLSPSNYHWMNYTEEKVIDRFNTTRAAQRGTDLHAFAHEAIRLGIKMPTRPASTLNMYVNDGIGFRMRTEQILFYSINCFGSADALAFRRNPKTKRMKLRISDLKTGENPASPHQLEVYAAIFCLEYRFRPSEIEFDLRLYQNDEIISFTDDDPETGFDTLNNIVHIMDRIVTFDKLLNSLREDSN